MSNGLRKAAVRGLFYPDKCSEVQNRIHTFNATYDTLDIKPEYRSIMPQAVIVPHAGYIYSGYTANFAYRFLSKTDFDRIIVMGPSHRHYFKGISGSFYQFFETPCGDIEIDSPYLFTLAKAFEIGFVKEAHLREHSTEVQMPFLRHYFPHTKVIEIVYGDVPAERLATILYALLQNPNNGIVISSDLSHYYPLEKAKTIDHICLESISRLDTTRLEQGCEACGFTGIKAMLMAAKKLHLDSLLLDYTTSAKRNDEIDSVVGYLSAMFYTP